MDMLKVLLYCVFFITNVTFGKEITDSDHLNILKSSNFKI